MNYKILLIIILVTILSCNNNPQPTNKPVMDTTSSTKKDFSHIKFSNIKDPVCGMKLKFGIADSLLYQGKIIAFCNNGCKEEFIKNPKGYAVK